LYWYIVARDASGDRSYHMGVETTTGRGYAALFYGAGGGSANYDYTKGSLCDGLLHQFVLRRSGTTADLFVDGVLSTTFTCAATLNAGTAPFVIGNNGQGYSTYYFRDTVDNVQVWDHALTPTEISDLFYKGLSSLAVANQVPPPSATGVARDTNIQLSLVATGGNIQLATVDLWVQGVLAYDGATDTFQSGFTGTRTGTPAQYDFLIDPDVDFDYDETVSVRAYGQDDIVNTVDETYGFTTIQEYVAPVLQNQVPAPDAVLQARDTDIYLEIADADSGVKFSSITVQIDRGAGYVTVFTAGAFVGDYTGAVVPDPVLGIKQYNVTIEPGADFAEPSTPKVRVLATDNATVPNAMDSWYQFGIAVHPLLADLTPLDGATGVSRKTNIALGLRAGSVTVVDTSVEVTVDGDLAYDANGTPAGFQPGYDGEDSVIDADGSGGFDIVVDPVDPLDRYKVIIVTVTAEDTLGHEL